MSEFPQSGGGGDGSVGGSTDRQTVASAGLARGGAAGVSVVPSTLPQTGASSSAGMSLVSGSSTQGDSTEGDGGDGKGKSQSIHSEKNLQAFMKQKGFDPEMVSSTPSTIDLASLQKQVEGPGLASTAGFAAVTDRPDRSPATYFRSYSQLMEWVDRSLDIYRPELHVVMWPLFVHTFIGIMSGTARSPSLPREFLDKFSPSFLDGLAREGGLEKTSEKESEVDLLKGATGEYAHEIQHLYNITNKEQIEHSYLIKCYRTYRYSVSMSQQTFQLLVLFLQESGLILMSSIFDNHMNVRIVARLPQNIHPEQLIGGGDFGGITGVSKASQDNMHKKEVLWGLLDNSVESKSPSSRDDSLRFDRAPPHAPKLSTSEEEQRLMDLSHRVALSNKALPSTCFFTLLNSHDSMTSAAFSDDVSSLSVTTTENCIRVYSLAQDLRQGPLEKCTILRGHSGAVTGVSYSPCARFLVSSSTDQSVRLWSLESKKDLAAYHFHNFPVWDVSFSPLGYFFATASHDRTALLWSTDSPKPHRIFAGHLSDVEVVKFHPNCNYIATGSSDKTVRLWDVQTGECVRLFSGHGGAIQSLAFSPDGKMLASAGEDKRILIWDLGKGKRMGTLRGHRSDIWSIDFAAPNGNLLASGSADHTVRIWDVNSAISGDSSSSSSQSLPSNRRKAQERPSPYLLGSYPTKKTPVLKVHFTRRNLLLGCGPFST